MERIEMYIRWEENKIKCACSESSPLIEKCPYFKYKKCSKDIMMYNPYKNLKECLRNQRSYKRINGALRQT